MPKVEKKLQNYLVLNKYLCSLFGFEDINDFRRTLKDKKEGINQDGKFYFTSVLQNLDIDESFKQRLELYDEHIQEYLLHINENRDNPISLKYFQYVALMLTEIHLDRYFNEFDDYDDSLLKFVNDLNNKEGKIGKYQYPYRTEESLRKLAYWSATGSGKTIIMHINYLQILKYIERSNEHDYDNILLITPNEGLSKQHIEELDISSIDNKRFNAQTTLDDWSLSNPVKVIEISKIKDERKIKRKTDKALSVPVQALGKNNILFVDEGHKGNSKEANTWKPLRAKLVQDGGFTFEYSATFGEVTSDDDTFEEYASSIIFDYRYKYFFDDGFGKDYSIINLKNKEDYGDEYFTGALLSFYEQNLYYQRHKRKIKPFNLENPLMIFVGYRVSRGEVKDEKDSDVFQVIDLIARFVNKTDEFERLIKKILNYNSSIVDEKDQPIFDTKFPYLRELIKNETISIDQVYQDIKKELFNTSTSTTLELRELPNAEGEIGLMFDGDYFGVINIGDSAGFIKYVEKNNKNGYFKTGMKSSFEHSLFQRIEKDTSKINFLIGSKKFIEGWNSYRVSAMGLLNVGKKAGSQIIQLFGRGVRLRGYNSLLKRSYILEEQRMLPEDIEIPKNMTLLETLNIFGMNANYMTNFIKSLKEEVDEYEKFFLKIKPTVPTGLYVPLKSTEVGNFKESVFVPSLEVKTPMIKLDLRSKIDVLESDDNKLRLVHSKSPIDQHKFSDDILSLLDFEYIYTELLKYKKIKQYDNLYFEKDDLKELLDDDNYIVECKEDLLKINKKESFAKIYKIQDYVVQALKSIIDKKYRAKKSKWYQKNLSYQSISEHDGTLIPEEYVFTINTDKNDFKDSIREITNKMKEFIETNRADDTIYDDDIIFRYDGKEVIEFFSLNIHLFKPLLYKNNANKQLQFIKISPVDLVESEKRFIKLIEEYLDKNKQYDKVYLLRNPSRKGVGFFETKGFYPDFILWAFKEDEQSIAFIDPKGLRWVKPEDEKIELHSEIKDIEKSLKANSSLDITLNSFIMSHTNYENINWTEEKKDLKKKNILFMEDGPDCINQLFTKMFETT